MHCSILVPCSVRYLKQKCRVKYLLEHKHDKRYNIKNWKQNDTRGKILDRLVGWWCRACSVAVRVRLSNTASCVVECLWKYTGHTAPGLPRTGRYE